MVGAVRLRWIAILLGILGAVGCATPSAPEPKPKPTEVIDFPPTVIHGDARLARMNAEELLAEGRADFAAKLWKRAKAAFELLADRFPKSPHAPEAMLQAGRSAEALRQWDEARAWFSKLSDARNGTGDALEAAFRLAEADYALGQYAEAEQLLAEIAHRAALPASKRLEATVQQGICQVEQGAFSEAAVNLRAALALRASAADPDALGTYFPAQAEFFLGEIDRLREEAVRLDPNLPVKRLGEELEQKASLLLSAQAHYLRAMGFEDPYWTIASGTEVGELYRRMYQALVKAPAPAEVKPSELKTYRDAVRKKIHVLLVKGIDAYQRTLDAASRLGEKSAFTQRAREGLEAMKSLLLSQTPKPSVPATPPPSPGKSLMPGKRSSGLPLGSVPRPRARRRFG